ncbi:MAG: hypothetical protein K2Y39_03955 [Candidatus Obscuribacterales bacterium]|nr:hypothetical protein [Candidatus Obscuribacterales bacterium]
MSSNTTHIWIDEPVGLNEETTYSAVIEVPHKERQTLWFKIPSRHAHLAVCSLDAFAVANIFLLMKEGFDCRFHGNLSPSLLRNLSEFGSVWQVWRPERYKQIEIIPDSESEESVASERTSAIAAFSGGVDSTHTIFRHTIGNCPKSWKREIKSCLFVHGFDIPLSAPDAFERAIRPIESTLAKVGIDLLTMSTNLQAMNIEWDDTHIAGLASTLMFFKKHFNEGLVASGCAYGGLVLPWGSNPITDHLLSSRTFGIVHDGASVKRVDKIRQLTQWSDGYDNLRICFSAEKRDENCGVCAKCVMDILLTRLHGIPQSKAIPELTDAKIADLKIPTPHQIVSFDKVVRAAKEKGITEPWVRILDKRLKQQKNTDGKHVPRLNALFKRIISG